MSENTVMQFAHGVLQVNTKTSLGTVQLNDPMQERDPSEDNQPDVYKAAVEFSEKNFPGRAAEVEQNTDTGAVEQDQSTDSPASDEKPVEAPAPEEKPAEAPSTVKPAAKATK